MPSTLDTRSQLHYGWTAGESGWNIEMDANIQRIGALMQIAVQDRDLTVPPTGVDGEAYIVATGGSGAWNGKDGNVAIARNGGTVWQFYAPLEGWLAYIVDEQVLSVYKTTPSVGWSTGVAI